jgi:hypothetical protein
MRLEQTAPFGPAGKKMAKDTVNINENRRTLCLGFSFLALTQSIPWITKGGCQSSGEYQSSQRLDPYFDDVLFLIEGSSFDKSRFKLVVRQGRDSTGLRQAWFNTAGISERLVQNQAWWEVVDPDGRLNLAGDFTIEFRARLRPIEASPWTPSGQKPVYGTPICGNLWSHTPNVAWVYFGGAYPGPYTFALRRVETQPVIQRNPGADYTQFHEFCIQRRNGVIQTWLDGAIGEGSVADAAPVNLANGGRMLIGTTTAWAYQHEVDIERLRITGRARYPGANYRIPKRYWDAFETPQYLMLHGSHNNTWQVNNPASFTQAGIDTLLGALGTVGNARRRLGMANTFSILNYSVPNLIASLTRFLALSRANDLPVFIKLDGVCYWDGSGLWNWFDPDSPGYNPDNVQNVERWGWEPNKAVKIGWRNWGAQHRVKPAPNLASPMFRAATKAVLDQLIPVIVTWYRELPADKKWLLAGVCFGWELTTYTQAAYFENGNAVWAANPTWAYGPLNDPPWFARGFNDAPTHWEALGYAAADVMGLQNRRGLIGTNSIVTICRDYLDFLVGIALSHGLEQRQIVTHSFNANVICRGGAGGNAAACALTSFRDVVPGWTFGGTAPDTPDKFLDTTWPGRPWAASECAEGYATKRHLRVMLSKRFIRLLALFNWRGVFSHPDRMEAVRSVLTE